MSNFGEEIVYWYLRFNGFFIIRNFVIHKNIGTSDADLLAVRFPYVYEKIGGQESDWDAILNGFDKNIPIGLICEVKTGTNFNEDIFSPENVEIAVGRFGFVQHDTPEYNKLIQNVQNNQHTRTPKFQIAKILFSKRYRSNEEHPYYHVTLKQVRKFLETRIATYHMEKERDFIYFPSNLIQYLFRKDFDCNCD